MTDDTLRFTLPVGVPLARLIEAETTFKELINEVARDFGQEAVTWYLLDVDRGSIRLVVQARPRSKKTAPSLMPEVVGAIVHGLDTLEARPERPAHFSNAALEKAKKLADFHSKDFPIKIGNSESPLLSITKQLVANVDKLIGEPVRSIGRLEGTLERVNIHGKRVFSIYDRLTGEAIECTFGRRVSLEDVSQAIGRRVAVYGEIRYAKDGVILGMAAERLELLPRDDELPSAEDVRGILG